MLREISQASEGADLDDILQPFQLESAGARGALVRMGPAVDSILERHDYPETVLRLLGEALSLAVLLAGRLKFDGIFTLQTQSDGPVGMMVADFRTDGSLRGMAKIDEAALRAAGAAAGRPSLQALTGQGYLAFTVDQGSDTDRYQGIVELAGESLAAGAQNYFRHSEQLATFLSLACERDGSGRWRGGGLVLQRMPDRTPMLEAVTSDTEGWHTATVLASSVRSEELVDPDLAANDLLWRLFHEAGVRVYEPRTFRAHCRCSADRVANVLRSFPRADVADMADEGKIEVTCEFCNTKYHFDEETI